MDEGEVPGLVKKGDLSTLFRFTRYVRPMLGWLILAILAAAGAALIMPLMIFMSEPMVRLIFSGPQVMDIVADSPAATDGSMKEWLKATVLGPVLYRIEPIIATDPVRAVGIVALAIILLSIVKGVLTFIQEYCMNYIWSKALVGVRTDLFGHMTAQSLTYFHTRKTGELMSIIQNDVELFGRSVRSVFGQVLVEPFTFMALLIFAFISGPWLTLVAGVILIPTAIAIQYFSRKARTAQRRHQERMADMSAVLQETFAGIRVVKAFSLESHQRERFYLEVERAFRQIMKVVKARALASPTVEILGAIGSSMVIVAGGYFTLGKNPSMTPEDLYSCLICMGLLYQPVKKMNRAYGRVMEGLAGADRLFEEMDRPVTIRDADNAVALTEVGSGIRFEHARFSYNRGVEVISDIDVEIPRGTTAALVGPSGAGKSTLMDLLARFHDLDSGRITINGTDLREIRLDSLRALIGIVPQEVVLFNDTIAHNIAYGRPGASREEIERAARDANADRFIAALPEGYETMVGERGTQLSGGQAQRIAIARALLKDPPILILDEATSALDSESERLIREAIDRLVRDRTTFIIAHRLSTITHAGVILVLDEGRLVGQGTHEELLRSNPLYRHLYELQFGARSGDSA